MKCNHEDAKTRSDLRISMDQRDLQTILRDYLDSLELRAAA